MPTILFIDDSHLSRTVSRLALARAGYNVLTASNGQAGFEVAQRHGPDCIVAALDMPALDGAALVKKLREAGESAPIILITSWARKETIDRLRRAGAQGFIERSCIEGEIVAAVEDSLGVAVRAAA